MSKHNYTITLNPEVVSAARKIAGLIPFSRWIESLILREIENRRWAEEEIIRPGSEGKRP